MTLAEDADIGILDLELYNLKHRDCNDLSQIQQFLTDIQDQLEELIVNQRKRVIIFKGIEPYTQTNKQKFKSSIDTFNKQNFEKERQKESKKNLNINFNSKNDFQKDSNINYEKTLFVKLLESLKTNEISEFQKSLTYLHESDILTNGHCEIYNNKSWNINARKLTSVNIIDDIELRLFYILSNFLSPMMKDEAKHNEGFMQLLKFKNKSDNKKIHSLIFPSFSDKITNNAPIESFHCMKINEFTTKIGCNEPLSNPHFIHALRSRSSSIPFLYPDVIPQNNHFVCFINLNDLEFDQSVRNVYSQVGYYEKKNLEKVSEDVFVYDLQYNLRMWEYFNDFKTLKSIINVYTGKNTNNDVHKTVVNNYIMEKLCKFFQNMDSWILMKMLNGKVDSKKSIHLKIKEKDGFKFFAAKFLAFIDFKDKTFYNFTKNEHNYVEITLFNNNVRQFSNPDKKKVALTNKLNESLKDNINYMIDIVDIILKDTANNTSGLTPVIKNLNVRTPDSKNKVSKPLTPKTKLYKAQEEKRINAIKKNIFEVDILNHEELLNVVKENKKIADLAEPTEEQLKKLDEFKLRQIKKIFANYDCGNGLGVDVIMSHDRLYGVLCDSNKIMNHLDIDEYEKLLNQLIEKKEILQFEISKERFYRLK